MGHWLKNFHTLLIAQVVCSTTIYVNIVLMHFKQGDSGGPLRAGDVLIGVVGRNFDTAVCGQPGVPALYARVTSYMNWINQNTATNKKK